MPTHTATPTQRRRPAFRDLDAVRADAERWLQRDYQAIGQWSLGQVAAHLAIMMEFSLEGFPFKLPLVFRVFGRVMRKPLLRRTFPSGIKIPGGQGAALHPPADITDAAGVDRLRRAIDRLQSQTQRCPSPLFGTMSIDQWRAFHCRHAELHLSFIVPSDATTP